MNFLFVIPFVLIIICSALIVKIATVALNLTGLDEKRAFFQAISAFTGTGFTTRDSESVVNNDIRRKIIMTLMVLGNAGLVSVITTLTLSFFKAGIAPVLINGSIIMLAILLIIRISLHKDLIRKLTKRIQKKLIESSKLEKRPVEEILRLAEGYGIAEVTVKEDCADLGKTLIESSFRQKDILIIAIERGLSVMPTPHADDRLLLDDTLICYGKLKNMEQLVTEQK